MRRSFDNVLINLGLCIGGWIMKAVILAGGMGTRLSEETMFRPKPMVEIGGRPILWHILKIYSFYGVNDFIICCGYKGYIIKEYFINYLRHSSDITVNVGTGEFSVHNSMSEPWRVTLIETGEQTMTGGRLKRVRSFIEGEQLFCLTYGDGLADVDVGKVIQFHKDEGRIATVTEVSPPGRFGALSINGNNVTRFEEKPVGGGLINGGFFVLSPQVLDYIAGDTTVWEAEPLAALAREGQLSAYAHRGFWQPMDTLRDKIALEGLWVNGAAPWKIW